LPRCHDATEVAYSYALVRKIDGGFLTLRENRINKVEALGAVFGIATFSDKLRGADVLLWIDNAAAEGCLNKGYSSDKEMATLAGQAWLMADCFDATLWIKRVPSSHKVADPLSLEDLRMVTSMGFRFAPRTVEPPTWHYGPR